MLVYQKLMFYTFAGYAQNTQQRFDVTFKIFTHFRSLLAFFIFKHFFFISVSFWIYSVKQMVILNENISLFGQAMAESNMTSLKQ